MNTSRALLDEAARRGLIGGDVGRHLAHSVAFAAVVESTLEEMLAGGDGRQRGCVADAGAGAGVPGLVIGAALADVAVTLIERREGRVSWLDEAVSRMDPRSAGPVDVVCADVYDLSRGAGRQAFDVVTARAFASPRVTAELAGALVAIGGALIVSEPPDGPDRWDLVDLGALGLTARPDRKMGGFRFRILRRIAPLAERFPRRKPR